MITFATQKLNFNMSRLFCVLMTTALLLTTSLVNAQDAHFSQFYANPLYLNPAMAGTNVCPRIATSFRDQWPSVQGEFVSYSVSYDQHFDKLNGGIGVLLFGDRAGQGTFNTYSANFMYSFKLKVTRKFNMRFALSAGYYQTSLDWSKLTFGDMIDPKYGFVYQSSELPPGDLAKGQFDFSAGMLGYFKNFYFGFAAHHIVPMYVGFISDTYKLPIKFTAHIGGTFDIKRKSKKEVSFGDISISPNIIYQQQATANLNPLTFHYFNEGFYLNFYPFTVGLWLRHSLQNIDAIIFTTGLQHEKFRIGYSYDITANELSGISGGAHEVTLQLLLPCPEKVRHIKDLDCPHY